MLGKRPSAALPCNNPHVLFLTLHYIQLLLQPRAVTNLCGSIHVSFHPRVINYINPQVLLEARMSGTLLPQHHRAVQAVRRVGLRIAQVGSRTR